MSQNLSIRMLPEALRSLAAGSISATYAGIGTAFQNPVRIFHLQNQTDVGLTFSWDGLTDNVYLPAGAFLLLDVTSNSSLPAGAIYFGQGQRLYVKGSPTTGSVYLSIFYGVTP
jgi:hypothetical protein